MSYIKKFAEKENTNYSNSLKHVFYFDDHIYVVSVIRYGSYGHSSWRFQKISLDGNFIIWERTLWFSCYYASYVKIYKLKNENSILIFLGYDTNPNYLPPGSNFYGGPMLIIKMDDANGNKLSVRNIPRQRATFKDSCYISDDVILLLSTDDNNSIIDVLDKQLNVISSKTISSTTAGRKMQLTSIKYIDNKIYLLGSLLESSGNKLGLIVEMVLNLTVSPPGISNVKNYSFQVKENGANVEFTVQNIFKNGNQFLLYANDRVITKSILLTDLSKTTGINIEGMNAGSLIEAENDDSLAFDGVALLKINKQLEILFTKYIRTEGFYTSLYLAKNNLVISFYRSIFGSEYGYDRYHYFGVLNSIFESCKTTRNRSPVTYTILNSIPISNTPKLADSQKPISTETNVDLIITNSIIESDLCTDPIYLKLLTCDIVVAENLQKDRTYIEIPVGKVEIHNCGTQDGAIANGFIIANINGLTFFIKNGSPVSANQTITFDVFLNATPTVAGPIDFIIDSDPSKHFYNDEQYRIAANVIEQIKVEIVGNGLNNLPDFIIGGSYNQAVGTIKLQKISGGPTTINAGLIHLPDNNLNGLQFTIQKVDLIDNNPKQVTVYVTGSPINTNSVSHKININFVDNNSNFTIDFTAKNDPINAYISNVNLKNNTIYLKDKQLDPIVQDYGVIKVTNLTKYSDLTIPVHHEIWRESNNNFVFRTKNTSLLTIEKNGGIGQLEIEVFIEGNNNTPTVAGTYDKVIDLTSLSIQPTTQKIAVQVKLEDYNVEVHSVNFPTPPITFIKGIQPDNTNIDYGNITLINYTETRSLIIPKNTVVSVDNGFRFLTKDEVTVPAKSINGGLVTVGIVIETTKPTVSGTFSAPIKIQLTNPELTIIDYQLRGIPYIVKDEEMNAEIIEANFYSDLTYVKGYRFNTPQNVGSIKVRNNTQTQELRIPAGTSLLKTSDNRGLEFTTKQEVIIYNVNQAPQNEALVPITVTSLSGANDLGTFSPEIDLSGVKVNNPSHFVLPFNIKEDVLDVRITDVIFNTFPILIKGQAINPINPVVGQITITNYSLVKTFQLGTRSPIHSNIMAGLVIKTTNPNPVTIEPVPEGGTPYQYTVTVTIGSNDNIPNAYGHFTELLNIANVNTGDYDVSFDVLNDGISVSTEENFNLQAPNFALQAVGSNGTDSPKSIQLRWMFSGNLGDKHLPKGTLTNRNIEQYNYDKRNDFVKLYRIPYEAQIRTVSRVNLQEPPAVVDYDKQCWIYEVSGTRVSANSTPAKVPPKTRLIHVYFRNVALFNQLSEQYDPSTEPQAFINAYGDNIIEMECKEELFFRVIPAMRASLTAGLYLEVLSVEESKLISSKYLSFRKRINASEVSQNRIFVENGRSIRYKTSRTRIYSFEFEFYSDFLTSASNWKCLEDVGEYGLSVDDRLVESRLGDITGKWLKYNNAEYVNGQNYLDRWSIAPPGNNPLNRSIKDILDRFIQLSGESASNPRALETINVNFSEFVDPEEPELPDEENGATEISNLDLLNMAAMDFHIARMLGLGTMDTSPGVLNGKEYIYLTEYRTLKDPKNENTLKPTQIISMSLPTSVNISRPPLPIEISELYKGVPKSQNDDIPVMYDSEGYSLDGKNRFISIISKPTPSGEVNPSFFSDAVSWDSSQYTLPIYGGLEYRIGESGSGRDPWEKPELSHSANYYSLNSRGEQSYRETIPIMLPERFGEPLFVHRQITNGNYIYATYGINIFSRASVVSDRFEIYTEIKPQNNLLPPSDINAWLIQEEKPLMFTSEYEQTLYNSIGTRDRTLVRLSFNYNSQDIVTHSIPFDNPHKDEEYINNPMLFPDRYDVFAGEVEIYFRGDTPKKITAALFEIKQHSDKLCLIFKTKTYVVASTNSTEQWKSELPAKTEYASFIGSVFLVNNTEYVIADVYQGRGYQGLEFVVYKEEVSQTLLAGGSISVQFNSLDDISNTSGNDLFVVTENMQSKNVWGNGNPNSAVIPLVFPAIHREIITAYTEKGEQKYLEKARGFWGTAKIEAVTENNVIVKGVYKISFDTLKLNQRAADFAKAFAEFNNGLVRVFRQDSIVNGQPIKSRDHLKVIKAENFGTGPRNRLVLYVYDELRVNATVSNPVSEIVTGTEIMVNYYPTYNVYLYSDSVNNLTKDYVLPEAGKNSKYSIFGLRTVDKENSINREFYRSKFSAPALMLGQRITAPQPPKKPTGSFYATRPDFYGRSTYSFTTIFNYQPFGVQFSRANNTAILNSLYDDLTIKTINENLALLGGNDESYLKDRWDNFFDFELLRSQGTGSYATFPPTQGKVNEDLEADADLIFEANKNDTAHKDLGSYALPWPDKVEFFEGINKFIRSFNIAYHQTRPEVSSTNFGKLSLNAVIVEKLAGVHDDKPFLLIDFVKEVVENNFVPLTEVPVLYQHIKTYEHKDQTKSHLPVDKKQTIRDASGYLLKQPKDPNLDDVFDMAPMMTILSKEEKKVLFTDFTLNGTTDNVYFYASREIGAQLEMSSMSEVLGPVKLVSSNAPEPPKILSGLPILENKVLGISPKVKIDINPYPDFVGIKRISLYRAADRLDAESILSMTLVKQIEVADLEIIEDNILTMYDNLDDLETVPYGDTLYYRAVADKQVQYPEYNNGVESIKNEYVPSQASKILALVLVETQNPVAPILGGTGTRLEDDDVVRDLRLEWNLTCYKGIYHLYNMSLQGNWKEIARLTVNKTNDSAKLQAYNPNGDGNNTWINITDIDIINSKIAFDIKILGADYQELALFDANNTRKYYHFKVSAENTSNMFSTEDNILTVFTDSIWDNLKGVSEEEDGGMIIGKTFIIK